MSDYPKPPFPRQKQKMPGLTSKMQPVPDDGENSCKGSGRLKGKRAVITGGDSGIGRAVAIAYAREGADILIAYLDEDEDARSTQELVEAEGRKAVLMRGDIQDAGHCEAIIKKAAAGLGGIDILVNNAAHQASFKSIVDIPNEEWELTFFATLLTILSFGLGGSFAHAADPALVAAAEKERSGCRLRRRYQ